MDICCVVEGKVSLIKWKCRGREREGRDVQNSSKCSVSGAMD